MRTLTWAGIVLCLSQAAILSGMNLAVFSMSRLRLEVSASAGNADAARLLALRHDANGLLATILWANVAANVLLTVLSDSVLTGLAAFGFSTVVITLVGEIVPQAYFSRRVLRVASLFAPLLRVYRILVYPVAKPTALVLDAWLGPEAIRLFRERDFRLLISTHIGATGTEMGRFEGLGAVNFLDLDDITVAEEGEPLDPRSVIELPLADGRPVLPPFERRIDDPWLRRVDASGKKWVIITDPQGRPRSVLNAHQFLRDALLSGDSFNRGAYWHRPIVVTDPRTRLGEAIGQMRVLPQSPDDDVIDNRPDSGLGPREAHYHRRRSARTAAEGRRRHREPGRRAAFGSVRDRSRRTGEASNRLKALLPVT